MKSNIIFCVCDLCLNLWEHFSLINLHKSNRKLNKIFRLNVYLHYEAIVIYGILDLLQFYIQNRHRRLLLYHQVAILSRALMILLVDLLGEKLWNEFRLYFEFWWKNCILQIFMLFVMKIKLENDMKLKKF